ncbi:MAG: hypothetical protein KAW93_00675 [Methanogenium sp.]|nr:hypothetical protein [Methanogenium sp.]
MKIEGDNIFFKSRDPFYQKEWRGLKPNTIRSIDPKLDLSDLKHITIVHKDTDAHFTRVLTDISVVGSVLERELVVFSWDPKAIV